MTAHYLLKDLAFLEPVRRLQRTRQHPRDDSSRYSDSDGEFNVIGVYVIGIVMIAIVAIGCFRMVRICVSRRRVNVMDATELPDDKSVHKIPKSTLAKRKQDILELFETSQVTMKVTVDDIHEEDGRIEDVESGFDDGGILRLSRPVATTTGNPSTPPPDASSPLPSPPELFDVPNLCAICLDSYQPGQVVAWSSGCTHAFHQDCISHYLAKKMIGGESPCPSCRQKFCDLPGEPVMASSLSTIGNINSTSTDTEEAGQRP